MRKIPSLGATVAVAMAEFNAPDLSPSRPTPAAEAKCDAHKCPWWPYTSSRDLKANTALIIVILCCALICTLAFNAVVRYIVRAYCVTRRSRNAPPNSKIDEQETEIPTLIYTEGVKFNGEEGECIICLSEFAIGERIRVLEKCNHGFHVRCIQQWLISRSSCPTCRANCTVESNAPLEP